MQYHAGWVAGGGLRAAAGKDDASVQEKACHRMSMMAHSYARVWGTPRNRTQPRATATLAQLLLDYRMPCVLDVVDIDIQGGEYPRHKAFRDFAPPGLFDGDAAISLLSTRARRVHIGTHSGEAEDDDILISKFNRTGWIVQWHFLKGTHIRNKGLTQTPYGTIRFGDGVLSLLNTRERLGEGCSD
eukprot:4138860-Prymnesium_polylepis.1